MLVRPKKAPPKQQPAPRPAMAFTFPSPIRGLVLNENIAMPGPAGAKVLDNWICTTTGIKARAGTAAHVPLGSEIGAMFVYRTGAFERAFAATATAIYDVTSPSATTPTAAVTGLTSGAWSDEQFGTAGGDFLYIVNGTDNARLYDGTTWTTITGVSTPAITGVATTALSHVWSYASRLFFVEGGTMNAWYLPVDSIGGAAASFSLAGIFKKGGALLFGATWSLDAGDGLDDKCVFVSDQGEVAIYEGTNPGAAAEWRLAGVYNISKPLGPKAIMQAGGDLLIATQNGLVPLSQAIQRDVAALELSAVSAPIAPIWREKGFSLSAGNWEIVKWPSENIMIVSQPGIGENSCLVANLQTGAWSRFTGFNVKTLAFFNGFVYFGGTDGTVRRFQTGASDDDNVYTAVFIGSAEDMTAKGVEKTVAQMRATFRTSTEIEPYVSAKINYDEIPSAPPSASTVIGEAPLWGFAVWGVSKWGGTPTATAKAFWRAVGRTGFVAAPEVQITFGGGVRPNVELVSIDATFHIGALVT